MKKLLIIVKYVLFPFLITQAAETTDVRAIIGNTETITAQVETDGTVWVGTHNGLWMINKKNSHASHLTAESSILPANDVKGLVVTADGNVYAATEKGLFRFDGYAYLTVTAENSNLPASGITSIATDNDGNLWVGTENKGLVLMNNYKCRFFTTKNSVMTSNSVVKIKSLSDGSVYVQLADNGVVKIGTESMSLVAPAQPENRSIASRN
ncbi:MAG TPA: two-component regulator propeller domain-containing protein [Chitinophagales bacterium]|nr:two-component regulator propeller domain-containing protein [Chitinophagales bacterium]